MGANNTCIGEQTKPEIPTNNYTILLGDWLQSQEDYEFALAFGDKEARTVMTHEEWQVLHAVVMRALSNTNERIVAGGCNDK